MAKKGFKDTVDKLWKVHKNDLNKALKTAGEMLKESESYLKDKSEQGRRQFEVMSLSVQREKLYYEVGKALSRFSKERWPKDKKIQALLKKIKEASRQIKQKSSKKK